MAAAPIPKAQPADVTGPSADSSGSSRSWERAVYAAYGLALLASVALWFLAFRSALWLDETGSYWLIKEGFWKIAEGTPW